MGGAEDAWQKIKADGIEMKKQQVPQSLSRTIP